MEITRIYEYFDVVEEGCKVREILEDLWERLLDGNIKLRSRTILDLIENVFLFWYGIAWNNMEDTGVAVGIWIKSFFKRDMEDYLESEGGWTCPTTDEIERATNNYWIIG